MNKNITTEIAVGIILIIAIIAGGFIWLGSKYQTSQIQPTAPVLPTQQPATDQTQKTQPNNNHSATISSGWQTYQNKKYGFELSYLKDWEVKTEDGKEITSVPFNLFVKDKAAKDNYELIQGTFDYYYPYVTVNVDSTSEKDAKTFIETCKKENGPAVCPEVIASTKVSGILALKVHHCFDNANQEGIIVVKNGYVFDVSIPYLCERSDMKLAEKFDNLDKQFHSTFDQIINTFKFTN